MDNEKRKRLEEAEWKVGNAEDFLSINSYINTSEIEQLKYSYERENLNLLITLQEIKDLASWHYDPDADPNNTSPEDNVAHINGLIVKLCEEGLNR